MAAVELDNTAGGSHAVEMNDFDEDDDVDVNEDSVFIQKFSKLIVPFYAISCLVCLILVILVMATKKYYQTFYVIFVLLLIGGILGAWASWKFGVIMDQINKFKEENNKYEEQIGELRATKDQLKGEVDTIQATVGELQQDASELDEQLGTFDELRNQLADIAGDNEELNRMMNETNQMFDNMRETVLQNERAHLLNFFYECALRDGDQEMSKREYRRFLGRLSEKQRGTFEAQGTFEEIAGEDGVIDLKEFQALVEEVIANVDELLKAEFSGGDEAKEDY